jgi:hypothetical protein
MQGNGASESWLPSIPDLDGRALGAGMRDALDAAACPNGVLGRRIRLSAAAISRKPPWCPVDADSRIERQALGAACHGSSPALR